MAKTPRKLTRPRRAPPKPRLTAWAAFLQAHPQLYSAIFALKNVSLPKGMTLNRLVQLSLKTHAQGQWQTTAGKNGGITVVFVAFADQADFDALRRQHNGKPWASSVPGSVDGFQALLP